MLAVQNAKKFLNVAHLQTGGKVSLKWTHGRWLKACAMIRAWYTELHSKLRELGFTVSHANPSHFILQTLDGTTLALVYVDDYLVTAHSLSNIAPLLEAISQFWEVENIGEPADFLSIGIVRPSSSNICIHQADCG